MNWRNVAASAVLLVGLTQMAGELLGSRALKGIGAVTVIAPCPKVFCDMNGFEPFAADFAFTMDDGSAVVVTPELYSRMRGPYNRRNVYGAAIAGAPLLPDGIRDSVLSYGLGRGGPLRGELGISENGEAISLVVRDRSRGRSGRWSFRYSK